MRFLNFSRELAELVDQKWEMVLNWMFQQLTEKTKKKNTMYFMKLRHACASPPNYKDDDDEKNIEIMVSIQIKMMMHQGEMDYVGNSIYLGNYKDDDDEKKIKVRYWIPSNGIIIRSYKWLIIDCAVDTCARH